MHNKNPRIIQNLRKTITQLPQKFAIYEGSTKYNTLDNIAAIIGISTHKGSQKQNIKLESNVCKYDTFTLSKYSKKKKLNYDQQNALVRLAPRNYVSKNPKQNAEFNLHR